MFARVDFKLGDRQALLLPASSVLRRGQLEGVLVVGDQGIAQLRWVKLGRHLDAGIEVLSGLEPGDRYIVSPAADMSDGTPIAAR
jgi:multidrug efflux pump subunit AcrA (membrane-fusion protein)